MAAAGLRALNLAHSVAEAGKAALEITAPIQNLMVADRAAIGLFVTGRMPIRRAGDGSAPVEGADGAHDWIGWASGDQLPHVVAPASGHLVNANERVAPPDFPVFLGRDWFGDWRARRIRELLAATTDRATPARFRAHATRRGQPIRPRPAAAFCWRCTADDPRAAAALGLLRTWDGSMARDLPQPLIFTAWLRAVRRSGVARCRHPARRRRSAQRIRRLRAVIAGGAQGEHQGGTREHAEARLVWRRLRRALRAALEAAVTDLAARFGPDPATWRWGEPHQAVFANPLLSRLPLIGRWTTSASQALAATPRSTAACRHCGSFESMHGPAFRAVYDLADLDRSLFVVAPGQSGNPLSSHAADFLRRWRDGETITLGPRRRTSTDHPLRVSDCCHDLHRTPPALTLASNRSPLQSWEDALLAGVRRAAAWAG